MATPYQYKRLSKDDALVLLIDHQAGLISLVQDYTPNEFKNNVLALAESAKFFNLPTILTTSFENGPNGPNGPPPAGRRGSSARARRRRGRPRAASRRGRARGRGRARAGRP